MGEESPRRLRASPKDVVFPMEGATSFLCPREARGAKRDSLETELGLLQQGRDGDRSMGIDRALGDDGLSEAF